MRIARSLVLKLYNERGDLVDSIAKFNRETAAVRDWMLSGAAEMGLSVVMEFVE